MANLSLRGLDGATLARMRSRARRLKVSVNRLIVDTLQQHYAAAPKSNDVLASLAGSWTQEEADEFDAATRQFSEVDPALWAAQPEAAYRAARRRKPRARKTRD